MVNLRQAINEGRLEEFIAEREAERNQPGDPDAFSRALSSMIQTSKAVPAASKRRRSAD